MLRPPRLLPSVLMVLIGLFTLAGTTRTAAQDAEQLWADFCHYVLIAQPQLANEAAQGLTSIDAAQLLDAVEESRYENPNRIFERAQGMDAVSGLAGQLQQKIQAARLDRSREPQRIEEDIDRLNRGQRAFRNATERLSAAGQFAAPQMLAALLDAERRDSHSAIMQSMVEIGQPLVQPLSVALPALNPVAQSQIARVLADIGYPQALPALTRVIENPDTDASARRAAQAAANTISQNARVSAGQSAAQLYLALGNGAYRTATRSPESLDSYDPDTDTGVVWRYNPQLTINGGPGLVPIVVPGPVTGDAVAMQAAETALMLDADLDDALSLFIGANLRRENRLPDGASDPSYPSSRQSPQYYAMVAGPQRVQDVLDQALNDNDAELALDAIAALSATASLDALQPLVRGLGYPDQRVRFRSAQALAQAMPEESFSNDYRVVPVLADALRQGEQATALAIAAQQNDRNQMLGAVSEQDYRTLDAPSIAEASGLVSSAPGVDLILVRGDAAAIRQAISETQSSYKLAQTPVIALAAPESQASLAAEFEGQPRINVVVADGEDLAQSIQQAMQNYRGEQLGSEESTEFALAALELFEVIAVVQSPFDINNALPALQEAVSDSRAEVAQHAGRVLALLDDPEAQASLADAALAASDQTQVSLLQSLAKSANDHGNLIPAQSSDRVLDLVKSSTGETANAAAQAHGALALPTRNAVDLILSQPTGR